VVFPLPGNPSINISFEFIYVMAPLLKDKL
jgi:hypothetical protein